MIQNFTKEEFEKIVEESYSIAEICKKVGLAPKGGNYHTIKRKCAKYNIDLSHLTGQNWKANKKLCDNKEKEGLNKILLNTKNCRSSSLKQKLIAAGLKQDICEICGQTNEWNGKSLTLELHHINGNHFDNSLENLQVLCPNCHTQQPNNRKPKTQSPKLKQKKEELKKCTCMQCGKEFLSDRLDKIRKFCSIDCYREYVKKFGNKNIQNHISKTSKKLSKEEIQNAMNDCIYITDLADKLNCHRQTVRTYLIKYGLYDDFSKKYIACNSRKK